MFVCWGAMRASLACEFRLGEAVFGGCVSAFFAAVRGAPGVDLNPATPSIFRFGAQNRARYHAIHRRSVTNSGDPATFPSGSGPRFGGLEGQASAPPTSRDT